MLQTIFSERLTKHPSHLFALFKHLHDSFGKFVILRGYEQLPFAYSNDIDVFVQVKSLSDFYSSIIDFSARNCFLKINTSRLGLIKCDLFLGEDIIHLDIWYGFYYFGLEYQDCKSLFDDAHVHESGLFYIPNISSEIRISILKEILHNGRVREDKAIYILESLSLCRHTLPVPFFSSRDLGRFYLFLISMHIRFKLFIYNFNISPIGTLKNIYIFLYVKYVARNKFHWDMFLK